MKELFTPFLNWRTHVLAILAMVALVLLVGDTDDMGMFFIIKPLGFGICYIIYRLAKYWDGKGKINELMELANEE